MSLAVGHKTSLYPASCGGTTLHTERSSHHGHLFTESEAKAETETEASCEAKAETADQAKAKAQDKEVVLQR